MAACAMKEKRFHGPPVQTVNLQQSGPIYVPRFTTSGLRRAVPHHTREVSRKQGYKDLKALPPTSSGRGRCERDRNQFTTNATKFPARLQPDDIQKVPTKVRRNSLRGKMKIVPRGFEPLDNNRTKGRKCKFRDIGYGMGIRGIKRNPLSSTAELCGIQVKIN